MTRRINYGRDNTMHSKILFYISSFWAHGNYLAAWCNLVTSFDLGNTPCQKQEIKFYWVKTLGHGGCLLL